MVSKLLSSLTVCQAPCARHYVSGTYVSGAGPCNAATCLAVGNSQRTISLLHSLQFVAFIRGASCMSGPVGYAFVTHTHTHDTQKDGYDNRVRLMIKRAVYCKG